MVADKLVVSLLGESLLGELNQWEEDATTLCSSVLGNLNGEGRQTDECKTTHWYHCVSKSAHITRNLAAESIAQ